MYLLVLFGSYLQDSIAIEFSKCMGAVQACDERCEESTSKVSKEVIFTAEELEAKLRVYVAEVRDELTSVLKADVEARGQACNEFAVAQDAVLKVQFDAEMEELGTEKSAETVAKLEGEIVQRKEACRAVETRAAEDLSHLDSALRQELASLKALLNAKVQAEEAQRLRGLTANMEKFEHRADAQQKMLVEYTTSKVHTAQAKLEDDILNERTLRVSADAQVARKIEWEAKQHLDLFEVAAVLNSVVARVADDGVQSDMLRIRQDTATQFSHVMGLHRQDMLNTHAVIEQRHGEACDHTTDMVEDLTKHCAKGMYELHAQSEVANAVNSLVAITVNREMQRTLAEEVAGIEDHIQKNRDRIEAEKRVCEANNVVLHDAVHQEARIREEKDSELMSLVEGHHLSNEEGHAMLQARVDEEKTLAEANHYKNREAIETLKERSVQGMVELHIQNEVSSCIQRVVGYIEESDASELAMVQRDAIQTLREEVNAQASSTGDALLKVGERIEEQNDALVIKIAEQDMSLREAIYDTEANVEQTRVVAQTLESLVREVCEQEGDVQLEAAQKAQTDLRNRVESLSETAANLSEATVVNIKSLETVLAKVEDLKLNLKSFESSSESAKGESDPSLGIDPAELEAQLKKLGDKFMLLHLEAKKTVTQLEEHCEVNACLDRLSR
jgi:hypothetical protein